MPRKLLKHLAEASDPQHREVLHAQIEHSSHLRAERASRAKSPTPRQTGQQQLHRQIFDAQGRTLLPGRLVRGESDPPVRDQHADQAYENIGIALQFFREVLGRDSVDGRGMRIDASVHYGYLFANAMWTGEQMIVGDGDGKHVIGLAHSLGIIAHEFTHGVSQHIVKGGLGVVQLAGQPPMLKGEAGALNESFSDVFASMIKQWHAQQDVHEAAWLLGEDILAAGSGKAIRSLKAPGNRRFTWREDDQIADYKLYRGTDDPHKAAGIPNHAFYVAAMALGGRSWETLAAVWLRAFDRLRCRASFLNAAHATLDVAAALHGKDSNAHRAVKSGWQKVNVLI